MRIFPDIPPAITTVAAIAAINAVIWILWKRPEMWKTMNRYFLISSGHPNAFAIVGSVFSHQMGPHLMLNMVTLGVVGTLRTSPLTLFT
jgi:membrane associated rhomboid family serine protease